VAHCHWHFGGVSWRKTYQGNKHVGVKTWKWLAAAQCFAHLNPTCSKVRLTRGWRPGKYRGWGTLPLSGNLGTLLIWSSQQRKSWRRFCYLFIWILALWNKLTGIVLRLSNSIIHKDAALSDWRNSMDKRKYSVKNRYAVNNYKTIDSNNCMLFPELLQCVCEFEIMKNQLSMNVE